jgi:hypothetical protein
MKDLSHQVALLTKVREQEDKKMRAKLKEAYAESESLKNQLAEAEQKRKASFFIFSSFFFLVFPLVFPSSLTFIS